MIPKKFLKPLLPAAVVALFLPSAAVMARGHHSHHHAADRREADIRVLALRSERRQEVRDDADEGPATPASIQPYLSGAYPHPRSQYVCLMDVGSGKILFAINPYVHREPASLTKIMAATVLLENGKLSDTVVAPEAVVGTPESSLHLRPGERISLEDLLYAMLLRSANDTPIAGASYLAGSIPRFVDMMNQKAQEIGCDNTHFVTPNGLYDPDHYSCARDLAEMARYAVLNIPMFDEIVKTQRYKVHRSIDTGDTLVVNTSSSFLKYYPGADGIKTGFISQAGHCFVGSATRDGWRLIAVALDSPRCREDVMSVLSYGFAHFKPVVVAPEGAPEGTITLSGTSIAVPVATSRDLHVIVSRDHPPAVQPAYTTTVSSLPADQIKFPIRVGDKIGVVTLLADGKPVSSVDAVATTSVAAPVPIASSMHLNKSLSNLGRIAGIVALSVVGLLGVALLALSYYARALTKKSRRRRARLASNL